MGDWLFRLAFVNLPPMPNGHHQDQNLFVLDVSQHPVVAYPVAPLTASVGRQTFAVDSGIGTAL